MRLYWWVRWCFGRIGCLFGRHGYIYTVVVSATDLTPVHDVCLTCDRQWPPGTRAWAL